VSIVLLALALLAAVVAVVVSSRGGRDIFSRAD
jgi:hypothetical protein